MFLSGTHILITHSYNTFFCMYQILHKNSFKVKKNPEMAKDKILIFLILPRLSMTGFIQRDFINHAAI